MKPGVIFIVLSFVLFFGCSSPEVPLNESDQTPIAPASTCADSDDGANETVAGAVMVGGVPYQDSCEDGYTLREYYCSGNEMKSGVVRCPQNGTCSEGACTPAIVQEIAPPACVDSDAGDETAVGGTVSFGGSSYPDACQGAYDVLEYYCEDDALKQRAANCGPGNRCEAGACVSLDRTCADSDEEAELLAGTATVYGGGMVVEKRSDYCIDDDSLMEYYCDVSEIAQKTFICDGGYYCLGGACVPLCEDEDGGEYPNNASYARDRTGSYSDYCVDDAALMEYVCESDEAFGRRIQCGGVCSSGRCYFESELECKESDHGTTVELYADDGIIRTEYDACEDYQTIRDYRCISDSIEELYTSCDDDELCMYGECEPILAEGCYDLDIESEDGPIHVASQVVETTNSSVKKEYSDICFTDTIVKEYECEGGEKSPEFIECPPEEKCKGGACVYPYTCSVIIEGTSTVQGEVGVYEDGELLRTERDHCSSDLFQKRVSCEDGRAILTLVQCPPGSSCDSETGLCR
ncbi:MAG: hypothetical protein V1827_00800 [Candidatus Micrarchaeota archaeon]